ncbi:methyl-accepting chemotaxis protein [Deefgea piscis]|uniref:Methyl-accepting chemotaxis protein n=1 Tax=Deefgea piscis TaxID=2739061 RepID=A0A6M8SQS1_9NEIS|nr:methyl-accepting chemotaxis protein [Deefgea piscis]QKJ65860.1 methyl-accepting chemotaxis protein [Deefgea piscis]
MKIVHKLIILILIASLDLLVISGLSYKHFNEIKTASYEVTDNILPSIVALADAQYQYSEARRLLVLHVAQSDQNKMRATEEKFLKTIASAEEALKKYETMLYDDTDKANLAGMRESFPAYFAVAKEIMALSYAEKPDAATLMLEEKLVPLGAKIDQAFRKTEQYNEALADKLKKSVNDTIAASISQSIIIAILSLLVFAVLGLFISRSITQPLNEMRQFIVDLGTRFDFTKRMPIKNKDEIGESAVALNGLLETLQASLQKLAHVGSQVGVCVSGLSNSSSELSSTSRGVSESASSMAAGVEQVTVSVTHVADRAQQCDVTAREAGRLAGTGGEVIDNTINSINQIADQVRQSAGQIENLKDRTNSITSVVNVIKDIADQTNLLALNAAIEAARAGELGRGFAVVADEVRKLAERTSSSTQEITSMVAEIQNEANHTVHTMQQTVRQVDNGVSMAHEASTAISNIRKSADDVVAQVSEISSSMREQSTASAMMAQQVERVAQMSEESSSVAEQTASEGGRLKRLGNELDEAISRYKVQ